MTITYTAPAVPDEERAICLPTLAAAIITFCSKPETMRVFAQWRFRLNGQRVSHHTLFNLLHQYGLWPVFPRAGRQFGNQKN